LFDRVQKFVWSFFEGLGIIRGDRRRGQNEGQSMMTQRVQAPPPEKEDRKREP
jgi:hypothetical protein